MYDDSLVSIIIPTRNAASTLEACLRSIQSQSYQNVEIIIVDNYSSDETRNAARMFKARIIIGGPRPPNNDFFTAPIQRRIGAEHASGGYIFFVDADMVLEEGLLEDCVERCLRGADAIIIPEISFGEGFWSRCKIAERSCYLGDDRMQASRFIRRAVYYSIGGWREDVGGLDDWEITAKLRGLGFKSARSNKRIFHNEGHLTLRKIFLKKFNIGKGAHPMKYLLSGKMEVDTIASQLTPFRILILLAMLPRLDIDIVEILGVVLMKVIEGVGFFMGLLLSKH